jgi:hypothetical protein
MKSIPGHDEVELVEKQLFESLKRDEPPVKGRHVVAAALGLGSAAITGATAAEGAAIGTAALKASPLLLVKWVGIGTVAGVISVGAIHHAMTPPAPAPRPIATVASGPVAKSLDPIARHELALPEPTPESTPVESAPREAAPVAPQPTRSLHHAAEITPSPPSPRPVVANLSDTSLGAPMPVPQPAPAATVTPSALAAEVAWLDQARAAVSAKNGAHALDVLGQYTRQFPSGTLSLEARVLRIEALYSAGSDGAAAALARDFLASHPTSTHATHVRRLLAEHEKP